MNNKIVNWLREPTTLQGFSLLAGALAAAYGGLGDAIAGTMASAALVLLVPEKSPLQSAASTVTTLVLTELERKASENKTPTPLK